MLVRSLHGWWIVALAILVGGAAGWIFNSFQHPVFEATAFYDVTVDQDQLAVEQGLQPGQLDMDFAAQNVYLTPVEDIFYRPEVVNQLVTDATAQGISIQADNFYTSNSFSIDRRGSRWFISVRRTDPGTAATLANLWVGAADTFVQDAQMHSAKALALQTERTLIERCFSNNDFIRADQCSGTSLSSSAELNTKLVDLAQQITAEQDAGRNVDPAIKHVFTEPAKPPVYPILYTRSLILLAGALIGFLAGIFILLQLPPGRKSS